MAFCRRQPTECCSDAISTRRRGKYARHPRRPSRCSENLLLAAADVAAVNCVCLCECVSKVMVSVDVRAVVPSVESGPRSLLARQNQLMTASHARRPRAGGIGHNSIGPSFTKTSQHHSRTKCTRLVDEKTFRVADENPNSFRKSPALLSLSLSCGWLFWLPPSNSCRERCRWCSCNRWKEREVIVYADPSHNPP